MVTGPRSDKTDPSGLAYLHSVLVVHHDLKPENILIYPAGTGSGAKEFVFKLARILVCRNCELLFFFVVVVVVVTGNPRFGTTVGQTGT